MKVCSSTRRQISQVLGQSQKMRQMWGAVANDALIATSLNRSRHDATDVFAVTDTGGELTVYVY